MKRTNFINKKLSKQSGITLVALVVSIIVLLILATVSVQVLTGDNGLLTKAEQAKNTTVEAEGLERLQLAVVASHDKNGINTTLLVKNLSEINGLTDINNQVITEDTAITLPKSVKLNNIKYKIKKDGTVIINNSILPDEYEQVEYIESSGTQWIDTKFLPQSNIKYKYSADFKLEDFSKEKQTIMGNDTCDIRIDKNGYINGQISQPYIGINRHSIVIEVQKSQNGNHRFICSCDGLVYASSEYTYWVNKNISIFTNLTYNNRISKAKIFSANIFNNDNIVRDFIPCYSTTTVTDVDEKQCSAGTAGLYDTVNGNFYTNQGTGTFGYETLDGTYVAPSPTNN